jgi:hypothetical protein
MPHGGGAIVWGGNCLGGQLSGGQLSGGQLSWYRAIGSILNYHPANSGDVILIHIVRIDTERRAIHCFLAN